MATLELAGERLVLLPQRAAFLPAHGCLLVADAREALTALTDALDGWSVDAAYRQEAVDLDAAWQRAVEECYHRDQTPLPAQTEVLEATERPVPGTPPNNTCETELKFVPVMVTF